MVCWFLGMKFGQREAFPKLTVRLSPAFFGGISAPGPEGEPDQIPEIIPAARVWNAVNADAVGKPRQHKGNGRDPAIKQAPEEATRALDGKRRCGTGGEKGEGGKRDEGAT